MWGNILPDIKAYSVTIVIKRVWYCWRGKHIDQWNTAESSEIDSQKYLQLIFDEDSKASQWMKGRALQQIMLN